MTQKTSLLTEIAAFLLGRRYYANIINTKGTNRCEISCYIFRSREDALSHRDSLAANMSFRFIETVSFRSRKDYCNLTTYIR